MPPLLRLAQMRLNAPRIDNGRFLIKHTPGAQTLRQGANDARDSGYTVSGRYLNSGAGGGGVACQVDPSH